MGPAPRLASPFDFCVPSARTGLPPDVEFAYRLVTANINFQSTAATAISSVILHLYSSHYLIYRNLVKSHCLLGGKKAIKSGQIGKLCIMSMIHCLALQTSLLVWKDVCICMLFWLFHLRTKSSDGIISRPLGHIPVDRRQYFMCNRMNNRAWLLYFE